MLVLYGMTGNTSLLNDFTGVDSGNSESPHHWYGGFAAMVPLRGKDYLPSFLLIALEALLLAGVTLAGVQRSNDNHILQKEAAARFWTSKINSQTEGLLVQGDCFYYAIKLRDLLASQGVTAQFYFVRWTNISDGPNIHVYVSAPLMDETWVMDNMGGIRRFPIDTPAPSWLAMIAPAKCPYKLIGDTRDMINYLKSNSTAHPSGNHL